MTFLVLISKHHWKDEHTTQFKHYNEASTKEQARASAIFLYPPLYIQYPQGLIAYFTGEIFQVV